MDVVPVLIVVVGKMTRNSHWTTPCIGTVGGWEYGIRMGLGRVLIVVLVKLSPGQTQSFIGHL